MVVGDVSGPASGQVQIMPPIYVRQYLNGH